MGTLFEQLPRQNTLGKYILWIRAVASEFGFDPNSMKADDWQALCDIVRTALAIQNADVFDEQLGGFGDIFSKISYTIEEISKALEPQ